MIPVLSHWLNKKALRQQEYSIVDTPRRTPYPAIWLTRSRPRLGYRVMPKCACSSVGQILHFLDHGEYYPGLIHDVSASVLKWKPSLDSSYEDSLASKPFFYFTLVRNPYKRLLSSFADKVFGFQSNGRRYRGGVIHRALQDYGVEWGPQADLVSNFRKFLRFVADTIEFRKPIPPDLHWNPCFQHLRFNAKRAPAWKLDFVGHVEHFQRDMERVLRRVDNDPTRLPPGIPRENSTSIPNIPISSFYGPDEIELVQRVYAKDFCLFRYGSDPIDTTPQSELDVNEVNDEVEKSVARKRTRSVRPRQRLQPGEFLTLNGIKVAIDRSCMSPKMLRVIRKGGYEREEAFQIPVIVQDGERIVELGGGIGYISALCGMQRNVHEIVVFEANPNLIPLIKRTHKLNDIKATVVNAVVLPKKVRETVPFYIREDFWASSLDEGPYGYKSVIDVPVVSFTDMIAEFNPTMLIVDIEGGEEALFNNISLDGIKKIYIELHQEILGRNGMKKLFSFFASRGFHYDQWHSSHGVVLFSHELR